jgi:anti-sigma factor RsiW
MARCDDFSEDLTAWLDGQLLNRRHDRVQEHLSACARCRAEADSLRAAIAWQEEALRAVTVANGVDTASLQTRLRRAMAAEAHDRRPVWRLRDVWASMWGRLALVGAAVSVAAVVVRLVGGPGMVLMPLGLESPPPAVAQHTELFKDYPLIERLDVLEHFDTVEAVPLDDERPAQRG